MTHNPGQNTDQTSDKSGFPNVGESTKKPQRPPESELQRCPRCGMDKAGWTGNDAHGVDRLGATYCCEGCAKNTDCICVAESQRHTGANIGAQRSV